MRWFYLCLTVIALVFVIFVCFLAEPKEKPEMLRAGIAAAIVNLVIFLVMSWAKKQKVTPQESIKAR